MDHHLHALTAVPPGKWATSHCKHVWVGLRLVQTGRTNR